MLEFVGHGNVVTHNFLVEEQKNAPFINIHQCKHKVKLKATATVNFQSECEMLPGRIIIFTLAIKGGSSSSMLLRFKLLSSNLSTQEKRLKACSNMLQKYKIPLGSNLTTFELLKNVTTVTYGQILNISMSTEHFKTYTFENSTVQFTIKSSFCYYKCVEIATMHYCKVLNVFDPFDTESSKVYGNKCDKDKKYKKYILHWSQILTLPHFDNSKVISTVLLPGIYEQVKIHISHTQTILLLPNQSSCIDVTWQDTNILQKVDISLQLNGKQYQIFTEPSNSDKMYTWMEAERKCVDHDGHLPSIISQSDVQDLVDIILRAVWTGPIRMIYIGLKVRNEYKRNVNCFKRKKIESSFHYLPWSQNRTQLREGTLTTRT